MGDMQRVMWKQKRGKCFDSFTPMAVDPERFELSSKHGTRCAFYMLILYLILETELATDILLSP